MKNLYEIGILYKVGNLEEEKDRNFSLFRKLEVKGILRFFRSRKTPTSNDEKKQIGITIIEEPKIGSHRLRNNISVSERLDKSKKSKSIISALMNSNEN